MRKEYIAAAGTMRLLAIEVSSNVDACRKHMELVHDSACITNALCVEHFNMRVIQILRDSISMPWICFRKTELR